MRTVLLAVSGSLLAALAAAQQPAAEPARSERAAAFGSVAGLRGEAVKGASVTLLHRPIPKAPEHVASDRVVVTTGEDGRFRAALLRGVPYSAWASWPGGATWIEEGVMSGDFVALAQDPRSRAVPLRVRGAEAWGERAPLTFRAVVGTEHLDFVPVTAGADGAFAIPPLPHVGHRTIEVLDRDGEVLWATHASAGAGDSAEIALPPPLPIDAQVVDAATGAPIAGAELLVNVVSYWVSESPSVPWGHRFCTLWPRVGVTDAEGRLRRSIAVERDAEPKPPRFFLLARKDGYVCSAGGSLDGQTIRDGSTSSSDAPLRFRLARKPDGPGAQAPFPDGPLLLARHVHAQLAGGGAIGIGFESVAAVRDGRVASPFGWTVDDAASESFTVVPEPVREAIAKRHGRPPPPLLSLGAPAQWAERFGKVRDSEGEGRGAADGAAAAADRGAAFAPERWTLVQVTRPDGRPAERGVVFAAPRVQGNTDTNRVQYARTDRLGRALLRHDDVAEHLVAAVSGDACASALATLVDGKPVRLQLAAMPVVHGVVRDAAGTGVPFAVVTTRSLETAVFHDNEPAPGEVHLHAAAWLLYAPRPTVADAEGRFRFPRFPAPLAITIGAGDARTGEATAGVDASTGTEGEPLVLQLPGPSRPK